MENKKSRKERNYSFQLPIETKEYVKQRYKEGNPVKAEEVNEAFKDMFKDFFEQMFQTEMESKLGYSKYDYKNKETENSRNGYSKKRLKSDIAGEFEVNIPRDRNGDYEPQMVEKHQRDISSIEDKILSMYAKGMSTSAINSHIEDLYKFSVSKEQVTRITDKILPLAKEWQNRPLEGCYTVVFLDGMSFDVREDGTYRKKTVYVIIGINLDGRKELMGLWIGENETSKYWLSILNDLKSRGVEDILIACVDGLNGFEQAINSVYPQTKIQRCIVHIIRNCTRYVNYKDRKVFCNDMKPIYKAVNEESALESLVEFDEKWGKKYPYAVKVWQNNWDGIKTMFEYSPEIRHVIYTTNAIEGFNNGVKRITKTKNSFTSDESLFKLLYLVSQDITKKWTMPIPNWSLIFNQILIYFEERLEKFL
ncbi:MAG: IS256 family transposase [Candidatus Gastranaerophilales bacterium]|nr:IS256 family transposase [Candidatus Gastranaerophilales bacterium]